MKLKLILFTFIALLTLLIEANPALAQQARRPCDDQDKICNAIKQTNRQFETAIANGNATAVANLYTDFGQVLPPNSEVFSGRDAIAAYWGGVINAGVTRVDVRTTELYGDEQTVTEVGRVTVFGPGGAVIGRNKYVVIWLLRDDRWLVHRNIFNSNLPSPPQ